MIENKPEHKPLHAALFKGCDIEPFTLSLCQVGGGKLHIQLVTGTPSTQYVLPVWFPSVRALRITLLTSNSPWLNTTLFLSFQILHRRDPKNWPQSHTAELKFLNYSTNSIHWTSSALWNSWIQLWWRWRNIEGRSWHRFRVRTRALKMKLRYHIGEINWERR